MGITSNINPYALYVHCDAAMDYDSKNSGGVGVEIIFPDYVNLESIKLSIGRYTGANIERLELEAIIQGMNKVINIFNLLYEKLKNVKTIILTTDRYGLNDDEKTSPFRIKEWRSNNWHNHDGKAIKNSDLLEQVDKTRRKLMVKTYCSVRIDYRQSKYIKIADRLAKHGKKEILINESIASRGIKIGKRKYDGDEVSYNLLKVKEKYVVHIYKKEPVGDQWEISVEFCDGDILGKKIKIYATSETEKKLNRHHIYEIYLKHVYKHHVTIYKTFKEIKCVSS